VLFDAGAIKGKDWVAAGVHLLMLLCLWFSSAVNASSHDSGILGHQAEKEVPAFVPPQRPVLLYDETNEYPLDQKLRYLEDPSTLMTIDDVRQESMTEKFLIQNKDSLNFGYTTSAFWIKAPVRYMGNKDRAEYWLELDIPLLDNAELFIINEKGKVVSKQSGYEKPLAERDLAYVNNVFAFQVQRDEELTLFIRVQSTFSMHMPLAIYTPKGFAEKASVVETFYGMFLGAMIIMITYNMFVFVSVREKAYFYYVLYIMIYLVFTLTERVHGLQVFGKVPPMFHKDNLAVYIWCSWIGAFMMARYFIDSPKNAPDMDSVLKISIYASIASTVISILTVSDDPTATIQWAVIGTVINTLIISWFGYTAMMRGFPGASLYFLAWFMNFTGAALYAVTVAGKVPLNIVTANSPQFGILCQLVFVSFALADRIKVAQKIALEANGRAMSHLQRYQSLFDNAVEGIFQISLERRFIDANPSMVSLMGYSSFSEMSEATPDALKVCYSDPKILTTILSELKAGRDVTNIESQYQDRYGNKRWAGSTLRIVFENKGVPTHLEGSFVDISEQKEKEKFEREREQDRMQRQVAEASANAKSQFLANMSHEIRTPLTAIIGYGESLLDESMTAEEKRKSAETVVRSGRHLLDLINDILDHSKIDANKLEVEIIPVSLLELVSEVKSYFEPKASQKGLEFSIQYDFPLPEKIHTDPTRLKQILINLCGNALKFTDRGSIRINVRCDRDNEKMYIRIVDTGIGLKPEQMSRLFDPFAQAAPSIAREYGGTGLGLNISKRLAELLGGTIRVTSTYGQGSEFEVAVSTGMLTSVKFIRDGSELSQSQTSIRITAAPTLRGSILYAEDNEVNRRLIELLVRKTGADLTMVVNGAEALKAASEKHFDLILMDIQMPVMDGRDATEAIRKSGNTTPIIALTANIMAEDLREYREAGCNDCLAKPVDKKRFYATLAHYLEEIETEPQTGPLPRFSGTVLVAEDNKDNQILMQRYLQKVGVNVVIACNGREAVQKSLTQTVDIVLMDHHMPEMEGPDAIRMLRQAGFRRPIYSFTASDSKDDLDCLKKAGSDGVLPKPVDRMRLYDLLGRYLQSEASDNIENSAELEYEELKPIIAEFISNLPERIAQMRAFSKNAQWDEVRKIAHQIKGIAGSMGYPVLTEKAKKLDMIIKDGAVEDYSALLDSVIDEAERAIGSFHAKEMASTGS
jgi:PAS domain S-box-containing protein